MNIPQTIQHLFPKSIIGKDFIVQDDSDGNGPYIAYWDEEATGATKPTEEELQAAWDAMQPTDADLLAAAQTAKKAEVSAAVAAKITMPYQSTIVLASTNKAHVYGTMPDDQTNMGFEYTKMIGNPDQGTVEYRTQDELDFVVHTRDEFKPIAEAVFARTKFYMSQGYAYYREIYAPDATVDSVNAIYVEITDPQPATP